MQRRCGTRSGFSPPWRDVPSSLDELISSLPLALLGVDRHGAIIALNAEAESLLRYPRNRLLGLQVEVLVPAELREAHRTAREGFARTPSDRVMAASRDLTAIAGDGTPLSVRISLKTVRDMEGVVLAGIVDLTAEKRLENELREQIDEMERRVADRTADLEARNREMTALLDSLESARIELERLSRTDPLTGITNRREFDAAAQKELHRSLRRHSPVCVAMLDLDHFKAVNDRHGHQTGDLVLRRVAQILSSHCRSDDLLARYGGEEFVLLLPETTLPEACGAVDRMRRAVEVEDWSRVQPGLAITLSAGVAAHDAAGSIHATIERADGCLYGAKSDGRNRVVPAPDPD